MSFKKRKVNQLKEYKTFTDLFRLRFNPSFLINIFLILGASFLIVYFSGFAVSWGKEKVKEIGIISMKFMSDKIGEPLQQDSLGQINVLVVGYGGENHQGGFLSDTVMLASYNPKIGTVSFLSIPRDLYIKYPSGSTGRINGLFANAYFKEKSLDKAALALATKVTEITGVSVNYYALVDFNGFKSLIDSVGGVQVDVPEDLVDTQYPTESGGYTTFSIKKGIQTLDGQTALKYVRSRHSTSDFSRAYRQQLVIKGLVNELLTPENLSSISTLKEIYGTYNKMVFTNISIKNMIGMAKYLDNLKNFYSFVLTAECNSNSYKLMTPGCFLYYPDRSGFGGASVILPQGARAGNISYYKNIHDFAYVVIYNQEFLLENAPIKILNGIDRKISKKTYASDFAVKLKNNGFNVIDVDNSELPQEKTIVYVNGAGDYKNTISTLRMMINIDEVLTGSNNYGDNLTIVLGNNYAK